MVIKIHPSQDLVNCMINPLLFGKWQNVIESFPQAGLTGGEEPEGEV